MIVKYEFHYKTQDSFSKMLEKLKKMGYNYVIELTDNGVELHIMSPNQSNSHVKAFVDLYCKKDGMNTYEVSTANIDDFKKLLEMFN